MSDTKKINSKAQYGTGTLLKVGSGEWVVSGSGYDVQVTLEPTYAPSNPDVGDVHIEQAGDEIFFYVWDGDAWIEAYGQQDESDGIEEVEDPDTPEQAYERAMRVLK